MKLAIFGSGPSGLLAAHAARRAGVGYGEVNIYSANGKSSLYGCQYLHQPIPDLSNLDDFVEVSYQMVGSPHMYLRKVYGDAYNGTVSPEHLGSAHNAWDIRYAYDELWKYWKSRVIQTRLDEATVHSSDFKEWIQNHDLVINTIPRNVWCISSEHNFFVTDIWAMGDAPALGIRTPFVVAEDNSVVCNGISDVGWYRMSRVFDHNTIEWPNRRKPPVKNVAMVQKPTRTDCDCWSGVVAHFGRYGEWKKGVLAHQVFDQAEELILSVNAF